MLQCLAMAFDLDTVSHLIRDQSDGLADRLDQLSDADWRLPSPCADWTVADVVAHLSSGAGVQFRALQRGLEGDTSPIFRDPAERTALTAAKLGLPESRRAADYRRELDELQSFFTTLGESDLARTAWHQSGVHPLRWFLLQRLGETTMHRGDVHGALGDDFEYPADVASLLLPEYVARLPRLLVPDGAVPALIRFGDAGFVRVGPERAAYLPETPVRPTLTLEAGSPTLLRIAVGRLHPQDAAGLQATGDTTLLAKWREVFRTL